MSELKSCPFCGSREVNLVELCRSGPSYVRCDGCGMDTPVAETSVDATDAWNRRTGTFAEGIEAAAKLIEGGWKPLGDGVGGNLAYHGLSVSELPAAIRQLSPANEGI